MSDLIERRAAIDKINRIVEVNHLDPEFVWFTPLWVQQLIRDLPSVQPDVPDTNVGDMKSCIYCHEDSDGYVAPIEKNCHAFIRFGMNGCELSLKAKGWHGGAKIRYCPMCGRELKT